MSHQLRRFKKEDSEGVKGLILKILEKEYPFDRRAYSDSDLDSISGTYGGERDAFFVIEELGRIAGTAAVKEDGDRQALLRRFFVDPAMRRRGYGRELLDCAIKFCREKGYKSVFFRCTDRMKDAMSLCVKNGFREIEALPVSGFLIHRLELKL